MIYQPKFLLPVPKSQWRSPSASVPRDQMGNETTKTYFIAKARIHDGHVVWRGVFEDRDDFDAFLWSIATGRLACEPDVWRLPTPQWHPDICDDAVFEFATQTFLTTAGSNQTYTIPVDWGNATNSIECVGGGASGAGGKATISSMYATGGGGGGYGRIENASYSPGASITYRVGSGGGTSTTDGVNGSETYFDSVTYSGAPVGGSYGLKGNKASGGPGGSAGGSGVGTFTFTGGASGGITGSSITAAVAGTGGGGAAGPNGNGNDGVSSPKGTSTSTSGGSGDAGSGGSGGAGGVGTATAGGNGTEWSGSYGCGGGGGGSYRVTAAAAAVGASGGNYGAGGGGAASVSSATGNSTSGAGIQGLIVVTYTPGALFSMANINIPILGL